MKFTRTFIGISSAALALAAFFVTLHFVARAKETGPAIRVESTAINRDARLGTSYSPVVKKAAPSVVNIFTTTFIKERLMLTDPFLRRFYGNQFPQGGRERTRKEKSLGSGVIVSADGYILTANHVVADADEIKVSVPGDKKEFSAKVIGKDRATDIAILKIQAENLPAVTLADSDKLEIGDVVLAIGNPFNLGQTVTMGIISALGRNIGLNPYEDFIQTDAAINPGNSGGALVDAEGRLIGINTAIRTDTGGYQGIGYAVPVNLARNVMDRLIKGGKVTRGYLGIVFPQDIDDTIAKQFHLPDQNGALVGDVTPNSPAQKAGLKSGDVILSINGKIITGQENLKVTISQLEPGTQATLKIFRNGTSRTLVATLGELPTGMVMNNNSSDSTPESVHADMLDGVTVADIEPEIRRQLQIPTSLHGALISDVDATSNSAEAGLKRGDIIVEINQKNVASASEAVRLCEAAAKDDHILVKIWRQMGDFAGTRYLSVDNTGRSK